MAKVVLQGHIIVPAEDLVAVKKALPEHIRLTKAEPGCLVFDVVQDQANPERFTVYEEFSSQPSFAAHQQRVKESSWWQVTVNVARYYKVHESDALVNVRATAMKDKIAVENVNVPGTTNNVSAEKYTAMKTAFLTILPGKPPGLTQKEIQQQVKAHLPDAIFPGGATSGWWAKTVQLDLEANGVVVREACKPLRWHRA